MPGWLFAGIVVVFAAGGVLYVRSKQKGAFVERLPIEQDEDAPRRGRLEGLPPVRRRAVRGGGTVNYRVRARLTDRRILVATGGPEGKHKFVILMILDYTKPASPSRTAGTPRTRGSSNSRTAIRHTRSRPRTRASRKRTATWRRSGSSCRSRKPASGAIRRGEALDQAGRAIPGRNRAQQPAGLADRQERALVLERKRFSGARRRSRSASRRLRSRGGTAGRTAAGSAVRGADRSRRLLPRPSRRACSP